MSRADTEKRKTGAGARAQSGAACTPAPGPEPGLEALMVFRRVPDGGRPSWTLVWAVTVALILVAVATAVLIVLVSPAHT